jgi:hypothetical protein
MKEQAGEEEHDERVRKATGSIASALPPDVRRGCASPVLEVKEDGLCPRSGFALPKARGRTGGLAPGG